VQPSQRGFGLELGLDWTGLDWGREGTEREGGGKSGGKADEKEARRKRDYSYFFSLDRGIRKGSDRECFPSNYCTVLLT
jgi:hypothetical protein